MTYSWHGITCMSVSCYDAFCSRILCMVHCSSWMHSLSLARTLACHSTCQLESGSESMSVLFAPRFVAANGAAAATKVCCWCGGNDVRIQRVLLLFHAERKEFALLLPEKPHTHTHIEHHCTSLNHNSRRWWFSSSSGHCQGVEIWWSLQVQTQSSLTPNSAGDPPVGHLCKTFEIIIDYYYSLDRATKAEKYR